MEIKTKHKKFKNFTDLYQFMSDSHLEEISVSIKYPDGTKSNGIMPIDMVLTFKCVEDIKSIDKDLQKLAKTHEVELAVIREIAETYHELYYFDDEDGELKTKLETINVNETLKNEIEQLIKSTLHINE